MARTGRPKRGVLDVGDRQGPVMQEACELDSQRRITVPVRIRGHVNWLSRGVYVEGLAILAEPGVIQIVSWDSEEGRRVLSRLAELSKLSTEDTTFAEPFRRFVDRYENQGISADNRLSLSTNALAHLSLGGEGANFVYMVAYSDDFQIWSIEQRGKRRQEEIEELSDLP